jgi:hypothetical protein
MEKENKSRNRKVYLPNRLEFSSNWFQKFQVDIYRPYLSICKRQIINKKTTEEYAYEAKLVIKNTMCKI